MAKAHFIEAEADDLLYEVVLDEADLLAFLWQPKEFLESFQIEVSSRFAIVFVDRVSASGNSISSDGKPLSDDKFVVSGVVGQGLMILEGVRSDAGRSLGFSLDEPNFKVRRTKDTSTGGVIHGELKDNFTAAKFMLNLIVNKSAVEAEVSGFDKTFEIKGRHKDPPIADPKARNKDISLPGNPILFFEGEVGMRLPCIYGKFRQPDDGTPMILDVIGLKKN